MDFSSGYFYDMCCRLGCWTSTLNWKLIVSTRRSVSELIVFFSFFFLFSSLGPVSVVTQCTRRCYIIDRVIIGKYVCCYRFWREFFFFFLPKSNRCGKSVFLNNYICRCVKSDVFSNVFKKFCWSLRNWTS